MLGVAVRGVGAGEHVRLLRARRHAGRGAAALHVEQHGWNFREIGEAEKFLHQRNARPRRRGEGARAVPAGADDDADGGELVLALHDGVFVLAGFSLAAQALAIGGEAFGERGRRRQRIPGADGGAAIDRAERGRRIAFDIDAVADGVGLFYPQADGALQIGERPVAADRQRLEIGVDQLLLALELFRQQRLDDAHIHVEHGRERAEAHDVLHQLALAGVVVFTVADLGQRHADDGQILAEFGGRHRARAIIEEVAAIFDRGDVLVPGLWVHRDHEVGAAARAEPALFADAHLEPGRQALNVGGEDVAGRHRHAHAHDGAGEQEVGGGRTGAVDVGEPNDEIVDAFDGHYAPARGSWIENFCMSQAPVGQRSAHMPQWRQTSSSFTITRLVLSGLET